MKFPVEPTKSKLIIKRGGKSTTKLVPLPSVIIDSREQLPYTFERFSNWVGKTVTDGLKTADYSLIGYESIIAVERKTLCDIVGSLMSGRERFLREMERLSTFKYKCLVIEATREDLKTPYDFAKAVKAHPNGIVGSLDALSVKYGIPVHYGCNRELSEEYVASFLSKCHAYEWLDANGHGRTLQEGDL
jgi:ERCC4-type nuclease